MMSSYMVVARDLVRQFGNKTAAVTAVDVPNLEIGETEFVSIMGPSGCGKSTLLHLLGGLDRPTSGEITVAGVRLDQQTVANRARFRRSSVGFVFQSYNLVPNLSLIDNIRLPSLLMRRPHRQSSDRASELVHQLGLEGKEHQLPASLSGGELQRAAIARALINRPQLLLADEPTGALDSAATGDVIRLLRKVNDESVAVVVVTHDARVASSANRLLTMRDGRIVDETRLDNVLPASFSGLVGRSLS